jgi:hypothetical protein
MSVVPRPLSPRERAVLTALLTSDFPGAAQLRDQAESVMATGEGMIIDLVVDPILPPARVVHRVPVQAVVDGAGHDGGLLLFVDDGRLSGLEYWWVTDDPPKEFPPITAMSTPVTAQET